MRRAGFNRVASALFHKQIHPLFRRAEEIFQRFDMVIKGGEDHSRVLFGAQRHQPQLAFFQLIGVAFRVRHAAQAAVQRIAPAVVRADEAVGFATAVFANGRGAMATAVQQRMHGAFTIAHYDNRLSADLGGFKAAGVGDFAGVRHPHPGFAEDSIQLQREQLFGGVQRSVYTVVLHQRRNLFATRRVRHRGIDIFHINDVVTLHVHSPARLRRSDGFPAPGACPRRASGLRVG